MKKKKIVFIVDKLSTGGAERVAAALANEISKLQEYEACIITYAEKEDKEYYISKNVTRYAISKVGYGRLRTIAYKQRTLRKLLKEIKPYCLCSLTIPKTNVILMSAASRNDYPIVLSERNDPVRFPTKKCMRIARDYMYKKCDGMVFQTPGAKGYFSETIQLKSVVIPNPLTADLPIRFTGEREHKIVNFCRIEPQKNLKMLINAFKMIAEDFQHYTLEFWGEGSQKKELQNYIESIGLQERILFHGYSENIHEEILKAALYVSTSNFEGISNSMLEAMAIGLPTICTDCPPGGARATIEDGINGKLVPVGDEKCLAETMKNILENPSKMEDFSLKASKLREKLSVDVIAKEWLNMIEEVRKTWE